MGKDLVSIGDIITIEVSDDSVEFSTSGDIGSAKISLRSTTGGDQKDEVTVKCDEDIKVSCALRFFVSFTKATPLSSHVTLSISLDDPIRVEYPIENMGHVQFWLGPKIDDEDF